MWRFVFSHYHLNHFDDAVIRATYHDAGVSGDGDHRAQPTVTGAATVKASSLASHDTLVTTQFIQNDTFESGWLSPWVSGGSPAPGVSSVRAHAGTYSGRTGMGNPGGYSSIASYIYETVTIPATAPSATLDFCYWAYSEDVTVDYQTLKIRNSGDTVLATLWYGLENTQT